MIKKITLIALITALSCGVADASSEQSHSLHVDINNSTGINLPLAVHITCEGQSAQEIFAFGDIDEQTHGTLEPGAADGSCTMTFAIDNGSDNPQSTRLPGLLKTETSGGGIDNVFVSIVASDDLNSGISTPIAGTDDQVSLAYNATTATIVTNIEQTPS